MTHRALQLAATSGPVPRPLALEEEFGELHIGVESGADYQRPLLEHEVQVSGSNPEFGEARKGLAWLANAAAAGGGGGGGGMWPEVCGLPLLGPGRPSLSGQAAWRQGQASRMGT